MNSDDIAATVQEFGNELLFAIIGLEAQPKGTKAMFEVMLRGRTLLVTISNLVDHEEPHDD